jgi:hypothetical protein
MIGISPSKILSFGLLPALLLGLGTLIAGPAAANLTKEELEVCTTSLNKCINDCDVKRDACRATNEQCDKHCYGRCRVGFDTCIADADRKGAEVPGTEPQPEAAPSGAEKSQTITPKKQSKGVR